MATFGYSPANDQTYKQILAGYQAQANAFNGDWNRVNNGYQTMINDNEAYGKSQRQELNDFWMQKGDQMQQSMVARGMGNTSSLDSAQRGVAYDQYKSGLALDDSILARKTDLQNAQLQYKGQAAQIQSGIGMQGLAYQQEALGQRYGAEANYVSQLDLGNVLASNQQNQQSLANQYAMQSQLRSQQHDDTMRARYGYY